MELHEYLTMLAEQLSHELRPILSIRVVTNNSDLFAAKNTRVMKGAYLRQ
jgi:hypothetical protein